MSDNPENVSWKPKEVSRLLRTVNSLLEIGTPLESQFESIDKFLKKPLGSSKHKYFELVREQSMMNDDEHSSFDSSNLSSNQGSNDLSSDLSEFSFENTNESCNEPGPGFSSLFCDDPDVAFLKQLIPDIKSLSDEAKSIFKISTQTLMHELKYPK